MFKMFFWGVLTGWAYHDEINEGLKKAAKHGEQFINKVKVKAAEMKQKVEGAS